MLTQFAVAILPKRVSHRLWLHRHDSLAAKQPSRWIEFASQFTLKDFCSFITPGDIHNYHYDARPIGTIHRNPEGKATRNTLSEFFNAMRMVVEAYERMIVISDQHLQNDDVGAHSIVVLHPVELQILKNHPDYKELVLTNRRDYKQTISLVEAGNHVYRIVITKK